MRSRWTEKVAKKQLFITKKKKWKSSDDDNPTFCAFKLQCAEAVLHQLLIVQYYRP